MARPDLHLLTGLPYSGKSTRAKRLLELLPDAFVFAVDPLLHERARLEGRSYHAVWETHFKQAEREMRARLSGALDARRPVIWDQLNLTRRTRATILRRVPADYKRHCHYVLCSDREEVQRRREARPEQPIAPRVYAGMESSFETPDMSEGFDTFEMVDTAL
ncbi:hypothetical protein E5163_00385 [Marinicauda algicola]|uniref:Uncharacterized protein n=1 Tax=Marinicauda algicola TaxID=2029849 RepID=A0A4S2H2S1_9PROT|nr:AAA family ATPase [Marinicauda algicola]TGY89638.1 hypothetical protein E5163_00385 [Marinicauda algicola]